MQDERGVVTDSDDEQATSHGSQAEDIYEQMCISLYAYRYGAIQFLELVAKFEESLGLSSPQTTDHFELKQPE